jgi:hypothetical protein
MILNGKEVVVLYLEDWQRRMIKDFLEIDCDRWEVPVKESNNLKYGVPCHPSENKKMYLTGWQMRELRDEARITCDFIELTKDHQKVMYRVPSERE